MSNQAAPDEPEPTASPVGPLLDVLRTLLGDHRDRRDTVLAIVSKLVARTTELERRLARGDAAFKVNEKVSTAQLVLFLDTNANGVLHAGILGLASICERVVGLHAPPSSA